MLDKTHVNHTYTEFEAKIKILHHPSTIYKNYEAIVHCGSTKQIARIIHIDKDCLRTGDHSKVVFRFKKKPEFIQEGKQICILSLGTRLEECKIAAEDLKSKGFSTTIVDARFAKPLDQELILKCAREHEIMITIEEGSIGGFGSHVKNLLAEKGVFDRGLKFRSMTLPDIFIEQDNPKKMYDTAGLNASQISKKILDILLNKDTIKAVKS